MEGEASGGHEIMKHYVMALHYFHQCVMSPLLFCIYLCVTRCEQALVKCI